MSSGNGDHEPTRILRPDALGPQPGEPGQQGPAHGDHSGTQIEPAQAQPPARRPIGAPAQQPQHGAPETPPPFAPLPGSETPPPFAPAPQHPAGPDARPLQPAAAPGYPQQPAGAAYPPQAPAADLGPQVTTPHRPPTVGEPHAEAEARAPATPIPAPPSENGVVTAWLVVVDGPGRGRAVELYYGRNIIGRSAEERISLDFGDQQISRRKAAVIIYDHLKHQFHLADGDSSNAIYVNADVLIGSRVLNDGDMITLGQTKLLFRPLCTADFNWETPVVGDADEAVDPAPASGTGPEPEGGDVV